MNVPDAVFVTGTDTGVGKTVVAAALAAAWKAMGRTPLYVKPVQSGAADGDDDAADVAALADVETLTGPVIGPSLAPAVAVRGAGTELTGAELVDVVVGARHRSDADAAIIEGAGGLLVELGTDGTTCADLAARLALPVVVVARPGLGTLNHTALTLAELHGRALELTGVVVCGYPRDPDVATRTNLAELARMSGDRLVGVLPRLDALGAGAMAPAPSWFAPALGGRATRDDLLAGSVPRPDTI